MATWKYCLDDELEHWVAEESAPRFSNRWLTIEPGADGTRIRVSAGYAWDGCTCAPDLPGTRHASCLHDAVYQFAEAISAASGWSLGAVLRWGDKVFHERMRADGAARLVAWVYYVAARRFGYVFHVAARRVRAWRERRQV